MRFYLGTHHTHWLKRTEVPLFISRRRLSDLKGFPEALGPWALDSGGFSELMIHGEWTITPREYVDFVHRCQQEIGSLDWAAVMDWMCEPIMLHGGKMAGGVEAVGTGLSVEEHQRRTVRNVLDLLDLDDSVPWVPVLQGWAVEDYYRHYDMYQQAGVDLDRFPAVGVGSVCRRGHTDEIETMMIDLARAGLRLHGFGFKVKGLKKVGHVLQSADSMAWSYQARRRDPLPECVEAARQQGRSGHKNCANCMRYALSWRAQTLESMMGAAPVGAALEEERVVAKKKVAATAEIMSREDEVLAQADDLVKRIGENYYELGQRLYEIEAGGYYDRLGYASFEEYCELRLGFQRTKAKVHMRMWEVLDQHYHIPWEGEPGQLQLKDVPWTNVRVVFPVIAPRNGELVSRREAQSWLKKAQVRSRRELQELVRQAKDASSDRPRTGERPARRSEIRDEDVSAPVAAAAGTETPFVDDPTSAPDDFVPPTGDFDADGLDAEGLDPSKSEVKEVDGIDPETGEEIRLSRVSFMLTREEFSNVTAALERMASISGIQHTGRLLDLMAAEVNNTLADEDSGGAAHRLKWYVENLERIFGVEIDVKVPKSSKLRTMSRVS